MRTIFEIDLEIKRIAQARAAITEGFLWNETRQGGEYWRTVVENLTVLEIELLKEKGDLYA